MNEPKTPVARLSRDDVIRRVKILREGLQLSRREFGEVEEIRQKGREVVIYTSRHTLTISEECWLDLGSQVETDEWMRRHHLTPGIN